jgi:hypothetical protein
VIDWRGPPATGLLANDPGRLYIGCHAAGEVGQ